MVKTILLEQARNQKMSDKIILRVFSKAGRSRVEISASANLHELKTELGNRLSIPASQIKLFTDQGLSKPLTGRDTASLQSLKLKNGDMLHVGNQDANLASVAAAKPAPTPASGSSMIDTTGKGGS